MYYACENTTFYLMASSLSYFNFIWNIHLSARDSIWHQRRCLNHLTTERIGSEKPEWGIEGPHWSLNWSVIYVLPHVTIHYIPTLNLWIWLSAIDSGAKVSLDRCNELVMFLYCSIESWSKRFLAIINLFIRGFKKCLQFQSVFT